MMLKRMRMKMKRTDEIERGRAGVIFRTVTLALIALLAGAASAASQERPSPPPDGNDRPAEQEEPRGVHAEEIPTDPLLIALGGRLDQGFSLSLSLIHI